MLVDVRRGRVVDVLIVMFLAVSCGPTNAGARATDTGGNSSPAPATPRQSANPAIGGEVRTQSPSAQAPDASPAPSTATIEVDCLLLARSLCGSAQLVHWDNGAGARITYLGFHLQPGILLRAPMDGFRSTVAAIKQPSAFQGASIAFGQAFSFRCAGPNLILVGDMSFPPPPTVPGEPIRAGAVIATMTNTGAVEPGGFNVMLTLGGTQDGKALSGNDLVALFPAAFARPPVDLPYEGPASPAAQVTAPFYDNGEPCPEIRYPGR
jgi:hypothetical protein